jgi:transcriptional regulator with XRE-family HTH domain
MPSPRHGEMRRKGLRQKGRACNLPDMKEAQFSPLTVLRLAAPDAPSLREVARTLGVSASAVSLFERGRSALTAEKIKLYAKAVGRRPSEVTDRWMRARIMYHEGALSKLRSEMRSNGSKPSKSRAHPRPLR